MTERHIEEVRLDGTLAIRRRFVNEDRKNVKQVLQYLPADARPGQPYVDIQFAIEEAAELLDEPGWNAYDMMHGMRPEPVAGEWEIILRRKDTPKNDRNGTYRGH